MVSEIYDEFIRSNPKIENIREKNITKRNVSKIKGIAN